MVPQLAKCQLPVLERNVVEVQFDCLIGSSIPVSYSDLAGSCVFSPIRLVDFRIDYDWMALAHQGQIRVFCTGGQRLPQVEKRLSLDGLSNAISDGRLLDVATLMQA